MRRRCLSLHCPRKDDSRRYYFTFSFPSLDITKHLQKNYPICDDIIQGYCGAKFLKEPPEGSQHGINNHTALDDNGKEVREEYYDSKGKQKVMEAHFTDDNPWMIAISISSLDADEVMEISKEILVYSRKYVLGGCSVYSGNHFSAVVYWHNQPY